MQVQNYSDEKLNSLSEDELVKETKSWSPDEQVRHLCPEEVMPLEEFRKIGIQMINEVYQNSQDWDEQEELRQKYAGIELPRLDPQGDWVTVEELRTILHKEVEKFYKKLKCDGKKGDKDYG